MSREEQRRCPSRIDPALKSWLDNVIIPSLVQEYLLKRKEPKERQEPKLARKARRIYARRDPKRKQ
jgi:hypothetical protein